jgi:hypothetical protein
MNKTGLSRPGAIQMVASLVLMLLASIGPAFVAATRPTHEWILALTGLPALAMTVAGIAVFILYVVGFLRYSSSKGYNMWVGLFLLLGSIPGFIALLLLPDLNTITMRQTSERKDTVRI